MDCFLKLTRNPLLMVAFSAMLFCDARCAFAALASTNNKGGVPPVVRAEHEEPVNVTGRQTTYDSKADTFTVTGDAVMTQGGSVLKADEIVVMRRTRQARATGNVHLVDPDVEIWASQADVDLEKETLVLQNAIIKAKKTTYHLEGQKVVKLEGQNYAVTKGFFTTCGCTKGAPDWSIRADQMDVDIGGTGTAHGASFDVLGHQLFKLPYAIFPADSSRHSGFLTGREGESGLRGIQFLQPYYIAINRSSDATVAFDIESSQRVGGLAEYRLTNGKDDYLWMDGAFYDESLRSNQNRQSDIIDNEVADPHIPLDRYGLFAMTRQHLTDSLTAYGDAISVSDSFYLREMDVWTLSSGFGNNFSSLRDAQSHFGLLDEFEDGFARLQGDWHQDLIQSQDFALQRLPQLQLSGRQELLGDLAYLDYDTEAVNFYRYQGQEGLRFDANPRITVPWRLGEYLWGYGSIGAQGAVYDSSGHTVTVTQAGTPKGPTYNNSLSLGPLPENGFQASGIPYAQAGIATLLEKTYDLNWTSIEKLKHMIEPFVNYAYVPRINQGNLPLFDQIDRVNSRSLFTVGFTTLLFGRMPVSPPTEEAEAPSDDFLAGEAGDATGVGPSDELSEPGQAIAPLGGTSYSNGSEVRELASFTLMDAIDTSHQIALNSQFSDIQANLNIFPTKLASLGSQLDYNPRNNAGLTFGSVYLNFQPPWSKSASGLYMGRALQGSFLQMSYIYVRPENAVLSGKNNNASQYMTLRAYSDLFDRLGVYVGPSYDFAASKLLAAEYGLRIKSPCDCWAADLGVSDTFNPNEVQVQFQLTFGGLGSVGRSPFGRNPFQQYGLIGQPTGVLPGW